MNSPKTLDAQEAARFEALAERWWDTGGPFWPLHRLNGLRVDWIRRQASAHFGRAVGAKRPLQGLRVLDVGCGGGILSESVATLGAEVHGVDVVERNIAAARVHARRTGSAVRYDCDSAEALAAAGARYDIVLDMEVVEHVADLPLFMRACDALVAPGGLHFVATINRTPKSFLFAIVGAEYVLRWLPRGTHRWRRFPTPAEIETMLRADGLEVTARSGVRVNPLTRVFSLTPSLAVNYMLLARRAGAAG